MVFSSLTFLCFFLPLVIISYYLVPQKCKNLSLLLFSVLFYAWSGIKNTLLLLAVVIFNYIIGILIGNLKAYRKIVLCVGIIGDLATLLVFKYTNFLVGNVNMFFGTSILINIVLPVGISFYIFQSISYLVDVYRQYRDVPLEGQEKYYQSNVVNMALYITFFPQLIAGPIVRYHDISQQLVSRECNYEKFVKGISRFIVGLAKKVILADFIGKIADDIFKLDISNLSTSIAWIGIICYALQIFFDFSGYSDMAIGLGKIFGFDFLENFNFPYISKSITEFWRRWHMSLSGWFRDYVYIPLGGNRNGNVYVNLAIVFLLTGIWHGADWGYVVWGIWHGIFILTERFVKKNVGTKIKIPNLIQWIYTMLVVLIGWVFFRSDSIFEAVKYIKVMFGLHNPGFMPYGVQFYLNYRNIFVILVGMLIAFLPVRQYIKNKLNKTIYEYTAMLLSIILLILCFIMIVNSTYSPFIYFQF